MEAALCLLIHLGVEVVLLGPFLRNVYQVLYSSAELTSRVLGREKDSLQSGLVNYEVEWDSMLFSAVILAEWRPYRKWVCGRICCVCVGGERKCYTLCVIVYRVCVLTVMWVACYLYLYVVYSYD